MYLVTGEEDPYVCSDYQRRTFLANRGSFQ